MAVFTDAQADIFRQWASSIPGTNIATLPRSMVQDGLTRKMNLTTQTEYQLTNRKEADSSSKLETKNAQIKTGMEIEFRPHQTGKDNGRIVLGLTIEKSNKLEAEEKKNESGGDVQLPAITRRTFDITVTIPVDKYFLINLAGIPDLFTSSVRNESANSNEQTILIIKATVPDHGGQ